MTQTQLLSAQEAINHTHGNVLLINPPVVDSRYPWIRWNQPLDLLKLGSVLSQTCGCQIKLFDFLLPSSTGRVPRRLSKLNEELAPGEQKHWLFGKPWKSFDEYLDKLKKSKWIPDCVWITTLTSYWWQTIPMVADRIKNKLKRPQIFLFGNYPVLELDHAAKSCINIDYIVREYLDLTAWPADFSLYEEKKLYFRALDLRSPDPLKEISEAQKEGTTHFVFFNDNLFNQFDTLLKPLLLEIAKQNWDLRFHGICGIETPDFPINDIQLFIGANFCELHFELALDQDGFIDEKKYRAIMRACEKAGYVSRRGNGWEARRKNIISGFLWIGRLNDSIEQLVWNALKILQLTGMVIPKPYSPAPNTSDYEILKSHHGELLPEEISPHRLPLASINGLSRGVYEDLYRMTALLNYRVRGHTFDFLGNSYLNKVIRESLAEGRWDV